MKVSFHVHIIRFDLGRSSPPLLTFFVSFSADEAGVQQKKKKNNNCSRWKGGGGRRKGRKGREQDTNEADEEEWLN